LRRSGSILSCILLLAGCAPALKEPPSIEVLSGAGDRRSPQEVDALLARAESLYAVRTLEAVREASSVWLEAARADEKRVEGLVGSVRAQIWICDHDGDRARREKAATLAVQSAQWCDRSLPEDPVCDYWLGAALGVQTRERPSTAIKALPAIVEAFSRAAAGAPDYDNAGPDRALALIYARAPGWPGGPGDPELSLEHARKAEARKPSFPPNQLALAEAQAATGAKAESRASYERALSLAREMAAAGDRDAPEWIQEAEEALKHRK
jgi:hypothetical protein